MNEDNLVKPNILLNLKLCALAILLAGTALGAQAVGRLADITVVDRNTGVTLPVYTHRGEYWVAGVPGTRYAISVRSKLSQRLMAVPSVDGINVFSGQTAAWHQSGYVFSSYNQYEITGWRTSDSEVAAFDMLYSRHSICVWRYVFRSVRDTTVADDLLQDVWFAVARQAANYQNTARFKTWLFTLVHNRKIDHFRTARHHASLNETNYDDDTTLADLLAADSGFGPVRKLQSKEQGAALIAAIEQLPPGQRDAFLLQAEGDLSVEEIAAACGVSFETAKSRLRYARSRLRQLLQDFA